MKKFFGFFKGGRDQASISSSEAVSMELSPVSFSQSNLFQSNSSGANSSGADLGDLKEIQRRLELEKEKNRMLEIENEQLKKGLSHIQSELATSVSTNGQALDELQSISEKFDHIIGISGDLKTNSQDLSSRIEEAQGVVSEVKNRTQSISKFLQAIQDIAMKSKILSFNASVEAMRAGVHGKGFAVVAEEIKAMSDGSGELVKQIAVELSQIGETTDHLVGAMETAVGTTSSIHASINEFDRNINDAIHENGESVQQISRTNDRIFMSLAKLDHVIWKINTYLSVLKGEAQFAFVDHNNCRLGKWYNEGDGRTHFGHLNSFKELVSPHSKVHDGTKQILDQVHDFESFHEAIFRGIDEMERASDQVFDRLSDMLGEKHSAAKKAA